MLVLILQGLLSVANWLVSQLPSFTLPDLSSVLTSIADSRVWQWVAWANWYVPLDLVVVLVGLRMAAWLVMWLFDFVLWFLEKAHIVGGE